MTAGGREENRAARRNSNGKEEEELSPDVREDQQGDSESDYGRPSGDSNREESGSEWQREHPLSTLSCFRCVSCEKLFAVYWADVPMCQMCDAQYQGYEDSDQETTWTTKVLQGDHEQAGSLPSVPEVQ